jgi:hypothetical protein
MDSLVLYTRVKDLESHRAVPGPQETGERKDPVPSCSTASLSIWMALGEILFDPKGEYREFLILFQTVIILYIR